MRLITFEAAGKQRLGAWIEGDVRIVDLARAASNEPAFASMQALIEGGDAALARARALVANPPADAIIETEAVRILAPLPRPLSIRDSLCFPEHLEKSQRAAARIMAAATPDPAATMAQFEASERLKVADSYYDFPLYYISNSLAVVGPDADVTWPAYSRFIDYELEWAAVIGKRSESVSAEDATQHIFGYTIFNDWSARDEQMKVMGRAFHVGPGPGKDFANSLGPCIVTSDEIPDPYALAMRASINGARVSEGSTSSMHYRFEDLIAYLTRAHALHPGEVICSGTVGGGSALEVGRMLKHGDEIALEVEKIGTLRNRVLAPHLVGSSKESNRHGQA
jgi:2-keto-4-pentenoate hydratase/2-oxohepta-3-ene-1,7-dioic acid hydratase in catechol pathway